MSYEPKELVKEVTCRLCSTKIPLPAGLWVSPIGRNNFVCCNCKIPVPDWSKLFPKTDIRKYVSEEALEESKFCESDSCEIKKFEKIAEDSKLEPVLVKKNAIGIILLEEVKK